MSAPRWSS